MPCLSLGPAQADGRVRVSAAWGSDRCTPLLHTHSNSLTPEWHWLNALSAAYQCALFFAASSVFHLHHHPPPLATSRVNLSLSLSLTHTHSHTHTHSPSASEPLSLSPCLSSTRLLRVFRTIYFDVSVVTNRGCGDRAVLRDLVP